MLLDGATGTELTRRGVDTGLPLWSANALLTDEGAHVLQQIHADYLAAGADIVTANTFRTHVRALAPSGNAHRALELTQRAVEIARAAIAETPGEKPRFVAGSISTLEDCYRPDLVPPEDECRAEHSERVRHLISSGVDLLLLETFNMVREAVIAAKLATISGTPVIVSFVCNPAGHILSGETLTEAARQLLPLGVVALGVNCGPTPAWLLRWMNCAPPAVLIFHSLLMATSAIPMSRLAGSIPIPKIRSSTANTPHTGRSTSLAAAAAPLPLTLHS